MDPSRENLQQFYRRSPGTRLNRHCYSPHGIFRPSKLQRPCLKWRKDHLYRGKRKVPYRKNDEVRKKTQEEVEEEERKKKLTDTATKLLSKLKTWNAEISKEDKREEIPEKEDEPCNDSTNPKPRRIAHSKTAETVKGVPKSRTVNRYDVNKETLKDFQNRIQHKLIEDIMQMPKETLQNMLNDPKINPVMEVKMTRLVKENKPLIAKKLRAMAEDKMKSSGSSQILLDFDKLIDPVIETDLSVLPYELIKEMEKVFQVQFDYSPGVSGEIQACDILQNEHEDVNAYECSTDEDEDNVQETKSEMQTKEMVPITVNKERKNLRKVNLVTSQSQTDCALKESTACQTYPSVESVSTQTDPGYLYGAPVPVEAKDGSYSSLMEEVNSIQNLINKLNEKRFALFLQLARMNPSGNFSYLGNKNFIETVSNGSLSLIESLTSIFRVRNGEQRPRFRYNKQRNYSERRNRLPQQPPSVGAPGAAKR